MKDWVFMPHAGHLCISHMCRFHLNTYVNGFIVSTVGEYLPPIDCLKILLESRIRFPKLIIDDEGKVKSEAIPEEIKNKLLSLKGDYFELAYLKTFGYEELGLNRTYETMVFRAKKNDDPTSQCCPWAQNGDSLDMEGYNDPSSAYQGHMNMCYKYESPTPETLAQIRDEV